MNIFHPTLYKKMETESVRGNVNLCVKYSRNIPTFRNYKLQTIGISVVFVIYKTKTNF